MNSEQRRRLAFALYDTARLMRKTVDQRVRALGLSHAQWSILATLARHEGLRQVDLASEMDLEPITVARLIDRLEAADLVERRADPVDRRARRLYLRPNAAMTLSALKATGDEIMASAFAGLDDSDIEIATALLDRLRTSFQAAVQAGHAAAAETVKATGAEAKAKAKAAATDRVGNLQHAG
jgi:MarR family transcriptional regulator for hemolysin